MAHQVGAGAEVPPMHRPAARCRGRGGVRLGGGPKPTTLAAMHATIDPRSLIQGQVRRMFGVERAAPAAAPPPEATAEAGDLGLFGPDAACWKVHGDFTSMMIGGVA